MTKIIDVIEHKYKYGIQIEVVVDEPPKIIYERVDDLLIGEHDGFFRFYKYERPSKNWQAFAGREFEIPLVNGGIEKAYGQWWDHFPSDYRGLVYSLGVASVNQLARCNLFYGMKVDRELVDNWIAENEPSNNYNKYNPKDADYGKHKIVSRWENV